MKKLIALLFLFLIILTGCTDKTSTSYYIDNGYSDIGEVEGYNTLQKDFNENESMYLGYTDDSILLFTAIYETEDVDVAFYSTLNGETCTAKVLGEPSISGTPVIPGENVSSTDGTTNCANAFAYFVKYAPDLANEINDLVVNFDLNEEVIKNGDINVIEGMVTSF